MQKSFAAFGVLLLTLVIAPLRAQESPWCVKLDVFTKNCAFADYNECVTVARNATSPATGVGECVRNPDYQPPAAAAAHDKSAPRRSTTPQR
jgi:hypothetical protein